ncbi:hypothetical protein K4K57_006659 [Colletotrichum sp. SAR 10_99]|nr:hypothetical protein K4K55_005946 [Colletotrichum sp. SAR 10_96]KAJ5010819.1 hypothetical protein K4K57_006659 [Colletotrichum sp. SAR 10_99]
MADKRLTFPAPDLVTPASRQELPPAKQTKNASRAHLLELPAEIILQIVDVVFNSDFKSLRKGYDEPEECRWGFYPDFSRFSVWRTVIRLAKTCKALNFIVTPAIYQADIKWNRGSSLLLGAKTGSASTIRRALEAGAEIDMWDFTELYDDFEYLHDRVSCSGQDPTRESFEIEMTALHWAAYHRHVDALSVLLEHGADIKAMGNLGSHFKDDDNLRFACAPYLQVFSRIQTHFSGLREFKRRDWLSPLLRGIADDEGASVLYYALMEEYEPAELSGQRDYTHEQRTRRTESKIAAVKTLLQAGASMTTHSITLLHVLHQACGNWDKEMVELLLGHGADVHARDILGNTPLHYVAMFMPYREPPREVVRVLLRHGADINAVNKLGRTPLQVCFEYSNREGWREGEETNFASLVALLDSESRLFPGIMQLMCRNVDDEYCDCEKHLICEAIALASAKAEPAWSGKKGFNSRQKNETEAKMVYVAIYEMLQGWQSWKYPETAASLRSWSLHDWELFWQRK